MPGRHHVFLLWMGLWLWVKMWDVGFAMVMVLDELMYFLMPQGPAVTEDLAQNAELAWKHLLRIDPAYSVQTYYMVMATAIGSVPVLTGVFVKRASGEVVDAVSQGFNAFAGKVGGAMGAFTRALLSSRTAKRVEIMKDRASDEARARMIDFRTPEGQKTWLMMAYKISSKQASEYLKGKGGKSFKNKDGKIVAIPSNIASNFGAVLSRVQSNINDDYVKNIFDARVAAATTVARWRIGHTTKVKKYVRNMVSWGYFTHSLNRKARSGRCT